MSTQKKPAKGNEDVQAALQNGNDVHGQHHVPGVPAGEGGEGGGAEGGGVFSRMSIIGTGMYW